MSPDEDRMTEDDFVIRDFLPADTDAVVQLWHSCGLTRPWNDPHKDIERKAADQNGAFWVASTPCPDPLTKDGGKIIGTVMIGYDGHRGSINYLAVSPTHQSKGLGAAIMQAAEAFLIRRECPKVSLCVRRENHAVLSFYDRLGYQADDIIFLGKRLISDD